MAKRMTEEEVVAMLRAKIDRNEVLFMPNCGCGLTAKLQEAGGADLICLSATSYWRMKGQGSLAPMMPYSDINQVIFDLAPEVVANINNAPILAQVGATNPLVSHTKLLDDLWNAGVSGINPFMMNIYGAEIMEQMQQIGMGWDKEADLIGEAHKKNMFALEYAFTPEEADIMERLERAFMNCEKLQQHMKFLLAKGSLYKVYNNNLLYHGCVPLNKDGTFKEVEIYGKRYKGKALYDILDNYVRKGFVAVDKAEREKGRDMMWYIWLNENSPLFGKDKMATFERYFLAEKETHKEVKNPYYDMLENEEVLDRILREFGLEPEGAHIINGHVPVKSKDGESPLKCGGKLLVIDGGFSRAYQKETGIAGYTLIYNSYGLILAAHDPFESTEAAIEKESDIHSESRMVKWVPERKCVGDTDIGRELKEKIKDLEKLLNAYYSGAIAEKFTR